MALDVLLTISSNEVVMVRSVPTQESPDHFEAEEEEWFAEPEIRRSSIPPKPESTPPPPIGDWVADHWFR